MPSPHSAAPTPCSARRKTAATGSSASAASTPCPISSAACAGRAATPWPIPSPISRPARHTLLSPASPTSTMARRTRNGADAEGTGAGEFAVEPLVFARGECYIVTGGSQSMPTIRRGASKKERSGFAPPGHDHALCVDDALAAAERQCTAKGARLTEQRRRVLELI